MAVTVDDVAQLAGISRATVSYVINNGPRPVSEETRQRVQEAIESLGYQPSAVARNLRKQKTDTIGLIVPDTHNPYFSEVAQGIESVAFEHGFTVFFCHTGYDIKREYQYVKLMHMQRVAGVIWVPGTANCSAFDELEKFNVNTVVIDRLVPGRDIQAIMADNFRGGYLATEHLIQLGHKRIGYISRPIALSHSHGRLEGYRTALQDYGIEFDPLLVASTGGFSYKDGYEATRLLLHTNSSLTAICTYNDIMAISAIRYAAEAGYRVPQDLSIVGFDDIDEAAYICPSLTTIHLPKLEMGQMAANMLFSLIEKKEVDADLLKPLDVHLVIRESTAPVRP